MSEPIRIPRAVEVAPAAPEPAPIVPAVAGTEARLPPENALEHAAAEIQVTPEAVADAVDGRLTAKVQAKLATIQAGREQFSVPGWDDELVVEVSTLRDRKAIEKGLTNEQLILAATRCVLYRDDDGELQDIGGWVGVGAMMGLTGTRVSTGDIVRAVLDNPLRLDGFAETILAWMMGRRSVIGQLLGE